LPFHGRALLALACVAALTACSSAPAAEEPPLTTAATTTTTTPPPTTTKSLVDGLPGMPLVTDKHNVYANAGANMVQDALKQDKSLVYVPHSGSGDVWVIDPTTFQVVAKYPAGIELQHVVPSYDMRTLYATDDQGDHLLPFDPKTGQPGQTIPVTDPYNMYFTPDGKSAISVAERLRKLVWYDPHTWKQQGEVPDCAGIDHADFSPDGKIAVFTCEFAGRVAVIDIATHHLLRMIDMPQRHTVMGPQDIKLAPDGSVYYIADSDANGLWVLDGAATRVLRFIPTGGGAHGLYLSRDAKQLYVTNRHEGSVSVLDSYTGVEQAKWLLPGGGSPDMGNVTADGSQLWLSGRYDKAIYVLSTKDGSLLKKIPVGNQPHGLCVWPQPGRYSLGHTGITR
jgi:DNA-binding beta-propeller fold protein YncE